MFRIFKNKFNIFLILIILSGIFVRTKLLISAPSFWNDECALGYNIISLNFSDFFKPLQLNQVAPPLFLVIEKFIYITVSSFTKNLKFIDISLRFFPYICGCLALPLFSYFIHKTFKNNYFTLFGTSLLAFNKYAIIYSNELKQYEIELLIVIALLILFSEFNLEKASIKKILVFSFLCIISMWFSSTAFIFILTGILILLCNVIKIKKNYIKFFIFIIPIFINILIYYWGYYIPVYSKMAVFMKSFWNNNFFDKNIFINRFAIRTNDLFFDFRINKIYVFGFYIFLLFNLFYFAHSTNNKYFYLCFIPVYSTIIASLINIYPYSGRLIVFLIPVYIIIFCQLILLINKYILGKIIINTLIILMILNCLTLNIKNFWGFKNRGYIRDMYILSKIYNPEDKNLITHKSHYLYYSRGKGDIIADPLDNIALITLKPGRYFVIVGDFEYKDLKKYLFKYAQIIKFRETTDKKSLFAEIIIK